MNGQGSPQHTTKCVLTYSGLHRPIILTRSSVFFPFFLFYQFLLVGIEQVKNYQIFLMLVRASLNLFHERNELDQRFDYPFIKRFSILGLGFASCYFSDYFLVLGFRHPNCRRLLGKLWDKHSTQMPPLFSHWIVLGLPCKKGSIIHLIAELPWAACFH